MRRTCHHDDFLALSPRRQVLPDDLTLHALLFSDLDDLGALACTSHGLEALVLRSLFRRQHVHGTLHSDRRYHVFRALRLLCTAPAASSSPLAISRLACIQIDYAGTLRTKFWFAGKDRPQRIIDVLCRVVERHQATLEQLTGTALEVLRFPGVLAERLAACPRLRVLQAKPSSRDECNRIGERLVKADVQWLKKLDLHGIHARLTNATLATLLARCRFRDLCFGNADRKMVHALCSSPSSRTLESLVFGATRHSGADTEASITHLLDKLPKLTDLSVDDGDFAETELPSECLHLPRITKFGTQSLILAKVAAPQLRKFQGIWREQTVLSLCTGSPELKSFVAGTSEWQPDVSRVFAAWQQGAWKQLEELYLDVTLGSPNIWPLLRIWPRLRELRLVLLSSAAPAHNGRLTSAIVQLLTSSLCLEKLSLSLASTDILVEDAHCRMPVPRSGPSVVPALRQLDLDQIGDDSLFRCLRFPALRCVELAGQFETLGIHLPGTQNAFAILVPCASHSETGIAHHTRFICAATTVSPFPHLAEMRFFSQAKHVGADVVAWLRTCHPQADIIVHSRIL